MVYDAYSYITNAVGLASDSNDGAEAKRIITQAERELALIDGDHVHALGLKRSLLGPAGERPPPTLRFMLLRSRD